MSLWNYSRFYYLWSSPQRRIGKTFQDTQRASLYTCHKASYTVEAAIVIPILAGFLVLILSFFRIIQIQSMIDEALMYAGRKTAVESSIMDSEEVLLVSAEGFLLYALKDNLLVEKQVVHGFSGIYLWESEFEDEWIILKARYKVDLPIHFLGVKQVELSSQNRFRKWNNGRLQKEDEGFVYVTPTGEVYHMDLRCRTLNLSVKDVSMTQISGMRGENGQKYYMCTRCDWEDSRKDRVYYTDYGTLYHRSVSCSALKRTVEKIPIEKTGNRRPCKICS